MTAIRAVLFDKDGTLLDYRLSWHAINRRAAALAARDDPTLAERLLAAGGADADGAAAPDSLLAVASAPEIATAWVAAGCAWDQPGLAVALDRLFTDAVAHVVPVTDLAALFGRLRAGGLRLGVASSDSAAAIHATAARFGFADALDFVAGHDSGFGRKPDPAAVRGFAAAIGHNPAAIAMVGDNVHDIAMGRAGGAGLCVGVLTGTGTRESLAEADVCLRSVADLEPALAPYVATGGGA